LPRLLADENYPAPSVRRLREHGFDVHAVAETTPGLSDREVLLLAHQQQRWLLTFDLDFGELVFNRQALLPLPPTIILIRASEDFVDLVIEALSGEQAKYGGFFVIDGRGMRWRPFEVGQR
jgi:predicted nuclease of predicted toxin-antitoxin system